MVACDRIDVVPAAMAVFLTGGGEHATASVSVVAHTHAGVVCTCSGGAGMGADADAETCDVQVRPSQTTKSATSRQSRAHLLKMS